MDVKAMARSKRSHTKHHQPRKPHRPTTQSTTSFPSSSSKDPKFLNKEGDKKRSNPGCSLPSNLDRYYDSDEEDGLFGSDSESAAGPISDAAKTDVVKPKSKGADFAFLISEALSQLPANYTDYFDSISPDFSEGRGSMLAVLGENILSWTGGDDFFMEDGRPTTSNEGSFLSLDLQKLTKDFARISHSERLFVEEEILPADMRDDKMGCMEQSSEVDDIGSSEVETEIVSKELQSECQEEGELESRFEAKAAEAELDTLLESLNEADLFGSSSNTAINVSSSAASREKTFISRSTEVNATDSMAATKSLVMEDFDSWLDTLP